MAKTHDYIQIMPHGVPHGGQCRIRIYQAASLGEAELPVVICSEWDNPGPGMSITNSVEYIAAEVLANHPDVFDPFSIGNIPGIEYDKPFVWIEHYTSGARGTPSDPHTFDLVEFSSYEARDTIVGGVWAREIGSPSWKPLDRGTVESLVGERLD
jgi:hypothetical protein